MNAMISLNYRDSRPIYEQIEDGLRKLIVTGALGADEKLPSVRALAAQLAINPNTIQRAYAELEREGFIYTVKGRGNISIRSRARAVLPQPMPVPMRPAAGNCWEKYGSCWRSCGIWASASRSWRIL